MTHTLPTLSLSTLFYKPLCGQTERDRDMKLSGFVDLIEVDVKMYVRNWSDQKRTILDQKRTKKGPKMRFFNFELEEKLDHQF